MKRSLGSLRPGLVGLAMLLCAFVLPATAYAGPPSIATTPDPVQGQSLAFGDQDIQNEPTPSQYKTVIVYSTGVDSTLTIGTITTSGSSAFYVVPGTDDCSGKSLPTSSICTVVVAFAPAALGAHAGSLNIPNNAVGTTSIAMSGTGVAMGVFSPSTPSHGFGPTDVAAGTSNGFFRITNAGSASMTFSDVSLGGADVTSFEIASQNCTGRTIEVSAYCDVTVIFKPTSAGAKSASLQFTHTGVGGSSQIPMTGSGIHAKFSANKSTLAFGPRSVQSVPVTQHLTVSNPGSHPLSVEWPEIEGVDAADFTVLATSSYTCHEPVPVDGSCMIPVQFDPSATGDKTATLRIGHNDPSTATPSTIALTGKGTEATVTASTGLLQFDSRNVYAGPSPVQTVTITSGPDEPVTVNAVTITGAAAAEFQIVGGSCVQSPPKDLLAGESCSVDVVFDPSGDFGGRDALLEIDHTGVYAVTTTLAGLAIRPEMSPFPGALAFEQRTVGDGASAPQWVRFENYGSAPLAMHEQTIAGAGAADYAIYFNSCAGRTLLPTEFCDVAVSFQPHAGGASGAVLRMTHDPIPLSVTDVPLSGSAVIPPRLSMKVAKPKKLRLRSTKTITYKVSCPATCTVTANANLMLPGKRGKTKRSTLGWKQVKIRGGKTGKIVFKLAGGQRVALAKAARARKKVTVRASFSAWAIGYSEAVATNGFKLVK